MAGPGVPQSHTYYNAGNFDVIQTVTNAGGTAHYGPLSVTVTTPVSTTPLVRASSSAAQTTAGSTSLSVPLPTSLVDGDLMILMVAQRNDSSTVASPPTGWTQQARIIFSGTPQTHFVFTRVYAAGQGNPTVSSSAAGAMIGTIVAIQAGTYTSDLNNLFMIPPAGELTAYGSSTTIASVTTTGPNGLRIASVSRPVGANPPTITGTSGWNGQSKFDKNSDIGLGTSDNNIGGLVQSILVPDAGSAPAATVTASAQNLWTYVQFVINPASAGGGGGGPTEPPEFGLAGDPGVGKAYMSWGIGGAGDITEFDAEETRMKAITYTKDGVFKGADATRDGAVYRAYRADDGGTATALLGGAGTQSRTIVQRGGIYIKSWEWTVAEASLYLANDPAYVAWESQLITNFQACATAGYTGSFWINLLHEPSRSGSSVFTVATAAEKKVLRDAHRKLYAAVKITAGCNNVSFMSTATNMLQDFYMANTTFNSGSPITTNLQNWWDFNPDWKGTFTGWFSGKVPNPSDFWTTYSSDPATTRTVDIWSINDYCWHAVGGSQTSKNPSAGVWSWTTDPSNSFTSNISDSIYEKHMSFNPTRNSWDFESDRHAYDVRSVLNVIYGTNVMPIALCEFGYPAFERSATTDPDLDVSFAHWDDMIQDLIGANVKAIVYWKANDTATPNSSDNVYSLGGKFNTGNVIADPQDTRRKLLASWMDSIYCKKI